MRWSGILDLIYPTVCELCEEVQSEPSPVCETCADQLLRVQRPFCETCGEVFHGAIERSFACRNCQGLEFAFECARAGLQASGPARQLVAALKYRRRFDLAGSLAEVMTEVLFDDERFQNPEAVLVPVPLHWWRQQRRRGNQAEELGRALSRLSGLPMVNALKRQRATPTQTRLSRKKRLSNLQGAIVVREKQVPAIRDREVILVDDVFTTGATAHECATQLIEVGGVQRVKVLTVMRAGA